MLRGSNRGDARVQRHLDRLGYRYEVDNDGDFKVAAKIPGGNRSQAGFINSNTSTFSGIEIREVWSLGIVAPGLPDADLANALLKDNAKVKFGAWRIQEMRDGRVSIIFAAHIAADIDAEGLDAAIEAVLLKADSLEEALTGEDKY